MKGIVTFNALVSPALIAGLVIPLTVLFLWLEWQRKRNLRTLRLLAVVVMMTMAAAVLLRPVVTSGKSASVLLLTSGYDKNKVDSLLQQHTGLQLWHLAGAVPYKGSTLLPNRDLAVKGNAIRFVTGNGLAATDLALCHEKTFTFIPNQPAEGIASLSIAQPVLAHHSATIDGQFYNSAGKKWIVIKGPGNKEDSTSIAGKGWQPFQLSVTPRQKGEWLYTLTVLDSIHQLQEEKLPVYVETDKPLRLLFVQEFPTFETQYLKNYLARAGHQLILRYQLSKTIFRFEYANRKPTQINKLTRDILGETDLLIIDGGALQKLTASERKAVKESVHAGLGALVLPLVAKTKHEDLFPFDLTPTKTDSATVTLQTKAVTLPALPARIRNNAGVQPLVQNKSGILTGYTFAGAGKLGVQLLQETYRLSLSGDSTGYGALWSPIVEKMSRRGTQTASVQITTPFPWYPDEPIQTTLLSAQPNPTLLADSIKIPLREDTRLDDVWHGQLWAGKPGWHILDPNQASGLHYYVSAPGSWETMRQNSQRGQNLRASITDRANSETVQVQQEIPVLYFFVVFVMAAGFLWIAPKL